MCWVEKEKALCVSKNPLNFQIEVTKIAYETIVSSIGFLMTSSEVNLLRYKGCLCTNGVLSFSVSQLLPFYLQHTCQQSLNQTGLVITRAGGNLFLKGRGILY